MVAVLLQLLHVLLVRLSLSVKLLLQMRHFLLQDLHVLLLNLPGLGGRYSVLQELVLLLVRAAVNLRRLSLHLFKLVEVLVAPLFLLDKHLLLFLAYLFLLVNKFGYLGCVSVLHLLLSLQLLFLLVGAVKERSIVISVVIN